MINLDDRLVIFLRIFCIVGTLATSLNVNIYSFAFFILTLVSLYCIKKKSHSKLNVLSVKETEFKNQFKSIKKEEISQIPDEIIQKCKNEIFDHYFDDFSHAESLRDFEQIKINSDCTFAKKSNLWGSQLWDERLSVKENIQLKVLPSFIIFCNFCTNLKLDGYIIELPGDKYGKDVQIFSKVFYEILLNLSNSDPSGRKCMNKEINTSSWVFEFSRITFFISTFLPCYPKNNPRFTFGVNKCYILFQPEISFAIHNLPADTPHTNWDNPKTVRDKIRCAFKTSSREYLIRETVRYPMCHDIIRPINSDDGLIEWWNTDS